MTLLVCLIMSPCFLSAQSDKQIHLKNELRRVLVNHGFVPTNPKFQEIAEQGDLFQAVVELFREAEATNQRNNDFGGPLLLWLKRSDDPRAHEFWLPYLHIMDGVNGRWEERATDGTNPRWVEMMENGQFLCWYSAVDFVVRTRDPEGKEWIQSFLTSSAHWNTKHAVIWQLRGGDPSWIEYLEQLPLTDAEEKEALSITIRDAIEAIRKQHPSPKSASVPPAMPPLSTTDNQEANKDKPLAAPAHQIAPVALASEPRKPNTASEGTSRGWLISAAVVAALGLGIIYVIKARGRNTPR